MSLEELLAWIKIYDNWVYGLLFSYSIGKTGPLPMVAGYAAALGALRLEWLLCLTLFGSIAGAQLRFAVGRFLSPWLCRKFPRISPWLALASAGVERYSLPVLGLYRFIKGAFSIVGIGAGASLLRWVQHVVIDSAGAALWAGVIIGIGYGLGQLGAAFDPRWSAYVGLALLATSIIVISIAGRKLKQRLQPLAKRILAARTAPVPPHAASSVHRLG